MRRSSLRMQIVLPLALVTLVIKTIAEHRNEQALKAAAELPPERPAPLPTAR